MASIRAFKRNFPGKKRDVAETKERAFPDSLVSFSLQARTRLSKSAISQSWREGATEVPPETRSDGVHAREHFACSNSTFSFPFPLPQFACPTATLVAFHLTILSTKLRPVGDAEKAGRKRNGRRRGEGETEMETRRATDCSNRVYEVPVDRKARGHVARKRGKGVILPCVTRITRAALKSTRRTFYRGQS